MSDARIIRASPHRRGGLAFAASISLGLAVSASGCTSLGLRASPVSSGTDRLRITSFAPLVREVMPAVVNVSALQRPGKAAEDDDQMMTGASPVKGRDAGPGPPPSALDKLLRRFFDEQERNSKPNVLGLALGSGFIIDPSGYVVTDDHVLENAQRVTVTFHDATQHQARIIGRDALTDLALLKVDSARPLPYVQWGDSDAAKVGDWVLAIGNPFGLDDTVSSGIISARGRDIHSGPYDDFLQIDASINRGNSGGPTFDLDGKVIGINSAIYSPNGGSVGIGFAIPANLARPVVEQLMERGKVERGWLGVQIQQVTPEIAQAFGLPKPAGALVAGISVGGPAARAGFAPGDIILSVDGHNIGRMRDLPLAVAELPIDQSIDVTVWRRNQEIALRPIVGEMAESSEATGHRQDEKKFGGEDHTAPGAGLKLAPLTAQLRQRLRVPRDVSGVAVTAIANDDPLAALDLLPGDVIESIDQQAIASPQSALAKLAVAAARRETVLLLINRHGSNRYLALLLGNGRDG